MNPTSWKANLYMVEQYLFRLIATAETERDYKEMERMLSEHKHGTTRLHQAIN